MPYFLIDEGARICGSKITVEEARPREEDIIIAKSNAIEV